MQPESISIERPDGSAKAQERVSISIVIYDSGRDELDRCFRSVEVAVARYIESTGPVCTVVINLINNSSNDRLLKTCYAFDSISKYSSVSIKTISGHGNIGYGSAINLGFNREPRGFHIFMNTDIEVDPGIICAGTDFFSIHNEVSILSPFCTDKEQIQQHLCKRYPTVFDLFLRGFVPEFLLARFKKRLNYYEMRELCPTEPFLEVPIASGCFMMCRGADIQRISGFDPGYFMYFEDFDFSIRIRRYGKVAYVPSMKITHTGGNAAKKGLRHIAMFTKSAYRFFNSHGWKWY